MQATFKKHTTPTHTTTLTGRQAVAAWKSQNVRCACGDFADAAHAVHGICNGRKAKWLGCPNCDCSALGRPLVYRNTKG